MLYGNLIFIKKTGGDGSKFPVTEKDIKIGRSEDCLIRIYNPQVAPEHCQLIIKDSGQATLRNLSNGTVLNGKPLGQGDTTLSHGDVFKIGTRSARWEYFPSINYKQVLTPTAPSGRQVAVVIPQQRSSGDQATPGTSTSQVSALRNTPLGKRMCSERFSESSSAVKIRKSSGSDLISKNKGDLLKLLTGRHSLKSTKLLLHGAKVKQRKSISGISSTKTLAGKAKGKTRKSMLPSWKVNIASPSEKGSKEHRNSLAKSVRKSTKPRKSVVKTPLNNMELKSEKVLLSTSKSEIKANQRTPVESKSFEGVVKSASKSVSKSSVKAAVESPSKNNESLTASTGSVRKSPSPKKKSQKSPSKAVFSTPRQKHPKLSRQIHSESKVNLGVFSRGKRKMSLILDRTDSPTSVIKSKGKERSSNSRSPGKNVADTIAVSSLKTNFINESTPVKRTYRKSDFTPLKKTPGKTEKSSKKSPVKKSGRSPAKIQKKTPRKSIIIKTPGSLSPRKMKTTFSENSQTSSNESDDVPSAKRRKYTPRKSAPAYNSPARKTPVKSAESTNKKFSGQSIPSVVDLKPEQNSTPQRGRKSSGSKSVLRKSTKASPSPRGVRRKLSPNSDAERAAKKLKTSSPKKPDKNKKKALLVLGIASRKQLLSQNVKVLLKRKIVKKAIKQSTAVAGLQDAKKKKTVPKMPRKKISKSTKKSRSVKKLSQSPKASPPKSSAKEKTPKVKKALEMSQLNSSAQQTSINLPLTSEKSPSKQKKKSDDSGLSLLSKSYASESPFSFEQSPENYLFNSNRRCSKRLSSKNETDRPDFIELCPTALGLIPKNVEVFKTPKVSKRRSVTLSTPKNLQSSGIIKSASTSKIGNRKSVRFSSKDLSFSSETRSPNVTENTHYDFTPVQTPNITVDFFVSPLTDKSNTTKKDANDSGSKVDDVFKTSAKARRSTSDPTTCVRKLLLSPLPEKSLDKVSSSQKSLTRSSRITASQSPSPAKVVQQSKVVSSGNLSNFDEVLFRTPKIQKSPKNSLSDLKGVAKLLRTPRDLKSPKNDLTDVRGVKKLFQTPKAQNSPKNDLTDVRGVKRLLKTPRGQKSPKNDLSDVRGVKKLLRTPKAQKSPKNDLSDVRGVKKLLRTPKEQKSPKNDLSDVRGVKKLLRTPRAQKSPKNDLSDLRGVKKLMQSPKVQKSPKNDLSDVAGVKQLLRSPRLPKSPRNELTDLRGVKNLLGSPRVQKSPKNELSDLTGVKALFTTTPRVQRSPRNNLLDVSGIGNLFESHSDQKLSRNSTEGTKELTKSLKSEETFNEILTNVTGVKQLLVSKSRESGSKGKKVSGKRITDFRAIRGRRVIYSTPRGPKNDLSDPTGVRELFLRHKPTCNFDISLTGVAELFELPKPEAPSVESKPSKSESETSSEAKQKRSKAIKLKEKLETEVETRTRGSRLRKVVLQEAPKRGRSKKSEEPDKKEKRPSKRKAAEEVKKSQVKRSNVKVPRKSAKSETTTSSRSRTKSKTSEKDAEETKGTRKRKAQVEISETSPPKLRRRTAAAETKSSATKSGSSKRARSEASSEKKTTVKTTVRSVKKAPAKTTTKAKTSKVQSKPATKTATKQVLKVQSRSQTSTKAKTSASVEKASPRKTRSVKAAATVQRKVSKTPSVSVGKKTVKSAQDGRKKASPAVKRSTRRK